METPILNPPGPVVTADVRLSARQRGFVAAVETVKNRPRVPTPVVFDVTALPAGSEVLLIRQYGLGDTLMMTPLLRAMTALGLTVDFHTAPEYVPLLDGNPNVRSVRQVGTPYDPYDYDAVLDLDRFDEHPAAEENNRIRHYARCVGLDLTTPEQRKLEYFLAPGEGENARIFLSTGFLGDLPRPWVAYVWDTNSESRNWSRPTHERAIREILRAGGSVVVLAKTVKPAPERPGVLNLSGAVPDLRRVAAVLAACDGVVSPDTGLFHLAAALDRPTAAYFGTFALSERASGAETLAVLNEPEARCIWAPCHEYECPFAGLVDRQSPCLTPEVGRLHAWVRSLPVHSHANEPVPVAADEPQAPAQGAEVAAGEKPTTEPARKRRKSVPLPPQLTRLNDPVPAG